MKKKVTIKHSSEIPDLSHCINRRNVWLYNAISANIGHILYTNLLKSKTHIFYQIKASIFDMAQKHNSEINLFSQSVSSSPWNLINDMNDRIKNILIPNFNSVMKLFLFSFSICGLEILNLIYRLFFSTVCARTHLLWCISVAASSACKYYEFSVLFNRNLTTKRHNFDFLRLVRWFYLINRRVL